MGKKREEERWIGRRKEKEDERMKNERMKNGKKEKRKK